MGSRGRACRQPLKATKRDGPTRHTHRCGEDAGASGVLTRGGKGYMPIYPSTAIMHRTVIVRIIGLWYRLCVHVMFIWKHPVVLISTMCRMFRYLTDSIRAYPALCGIPPKYPYFDHTSSAPAKAKSQGRPLWLAKERWRVGTPSYGRSSGWGKHEPEPMRSPERTFWGVCGRYKQTPGERIAALGRKHPRPRDDTCPPLQDSKVFALLSRGPHRASRIRSQMSGKFPF